MYKNVNENSSIITNEVIPNLSLILALQFFLDGKRQNKNKKLLLIYTMTFLYNCLIF